MIGSIRSGAAGRFDAPPLAAPALAALLLSLPALLVAALPGAETALEYSRTAIADGQWWRAITGHWTHWSGDHLTWDLIPFALLGLLGWSLNPRRVAASVASAAIAIPIAVWSLLPKMPSYRGLSGLDSSLFVFVAVTLLREERAAGRRGMAGALLLVLTGFVAKIAFEIVTGATVFADSALFVPVPLAHLVGGACGFFAAGRGRIRA